MDKKLLICIESNENYDIHSSDFIIDLINSN